jgi:peptide/nickel transport system substrate-binding protein
VRRIARTRQARPGGRRRLLVRSLVAAVLLVATLGLVGGPAGAAGSGGSLTVIEIGQEWPSLDPALDAQDSIDVNYMDAIYGQLFAENPVAGCAGPCKDPGQVVPDLAAGYQFSKDDLTLTIDLRKGVKFQDGTPLNAAAVVFNFQRDLNPANDCICLSNFSAVKSVTASGDYQVLLHLSHPYAPLIQSFVAEAPNWIVSPTALQAEPEASFALKPVGAGPYSVVSNEPNTQLVLAKNPTYWQTGHPLLSSLTFLTVTSDQSAYSALEAGQAQLLIGVSTPAIIDQAKANYDVSVIGGVTTNTVEFNTTKAPFNDVRAREAAAYAVDASAVLNAVSPGYGVTTQAEVGPGSVYYEKTVPGTRAYDLAKAKALVAQLGGLSFTYMTANTPSEIASAEALQSEWAAAGIKVQIQQGTITDEVTAMESNSWDGLAGAAGAADPDVGVQGLPSRFGVGGAFTCCKDTTLNALIDKSSTTLNAAKRKTIFGQIYQYIADKEYAIELYATPEAMIGTKTIVGMAPAPNGTAATEMLKWEDVGLQ